MAPDVRSPALLPHAFADEGRRVRALRLDEAAYRRASFLDGRPLVPPAAEEERPWADFASDEVKGHKPSLHFIFHLGHVGSTLLSRLLGEHPALFSLREPRILRDLAAGHWRDRTSPLLKLLARTWRPEQTALVKATSFVSAIGPELMDATQGWAILLGVTPPAYLRTLMASEGSWAEAERLAQDRRERLQARLGQTLTADTPGARLALGWLAEAFALSDIADRHGVRCLQMDFDRLLAQPVAGLEAALRHLGADPAQIDLQALASGPMLTRYSKAPEHAYDGELRRSLMAEAERLHGDQVRSGLDWLQALVDRVPAVRPVLMRSAAAARGALGPGERPV